MTQFAKQLEFQNTTPVPFKTRAAASGVFDGVMAATDVLYSQIIEVKNDENVGLEVTWTGTPTGVLQVFASISGTNFYDAGFTLTQPAGSGSGFVDSVSPFPYRYFLVKYTNASGSGVLNIWVEAKE
jgi:hypothetical protein